MASPRRIYVRLPAWVGDVVMSTPALRALRRAFEGAEIVVCGKRHHLELVEGLSSVDRVIADPGRGLRATWSLARELRAAEFDTAVVLGESERAAIAPALARIPVRVGYGHGAARRFLLTRAEPRPRDADGELLAFSMIERYLRIVRTLGVEAEDAGMEVPIPDAARASVDARLAHVDAPVVTVIAGAAFGDTKLWPAERFAAVCDDLAHRRGLHAVMAPAPGESDIAAAVAEAAAEPVTVLDGPPLSLSELAALIERSALALSNDTGPRSMAVALGTPVVSMLGPTDEAHTRHHLDRQRVLTADVDCRPCHLKECPIDHRCMTRIEPERALASALELLDEAEARA